MANLSGGAEAHARFKQYEYRANSSLVLTTDSRPRDTHEPTGELETLWGRIDRRNFGDRAVQARPPDLLHAALLALSFFLAGTLNNGNCLGLMHPFLRSEVKYSSSRRSATPPLDVSDAAIPSTELERCLWFSSIIWKIPLHV